METLPSGIKKYQGTDAATKDNFNINVDLLNTKITELDAHKVATTDVHGSTSSATANTIVQRNASGQFNVGAPTANSHAATKKYVDDLAATKLSTSGGEMSGDIVFWSNKGLRGYMTNGSVQPIASISYTNETLIGNTATPLRLRGNEFTYNNNDVFHKGYSTPFILYAHGNISGSNAATIAPTASFVNAGSVTMLDVITPSNFNAIATRVYPNKRRVVMNNQTIPVRVETSSSTIATNVTLQLRIAYSGGEYTVATKSGSLTGTGEITFTGCSFDLTTTNGVCEIRLYVITDSQIKIRVGTIEASATDAWYNMYLGV
ncbi:hypothetical protein ACFSL6_25000 [Paenibacillus thailandensis]|uniref:Tail fiber protein n=1 Tax=Paenibacillus thailandensis TaxID=393250 RepID=A0ABW5R3G2_9BACL